MKQKNLKKNKYLKLLTKREKYVIQKILSSKLNVPVNIFLINLRAFTIENFTKLFLRKHFKKIRNKVHITANLYHFFECLQLAIFLGNPFLIGKLLSILLRSLHNHRYVFKIFGLFFFNLKKYLSFIKKKYFFNKKKKSQNKLFILKKSFENIKTIKLILKGRISNSSRKKINQSIYGESFIPGFQIDSIVRYSNVTIVTKTGLLTLHIYIYFNQNLLKKFNKYNIWYYKLNFFNKFL